MNTLRFKKVGAATLSSALVLTTLTPMTMTADAATKIQYLSTAKIKNGKLVYKNSGKLVKGYARYNSKIYKNGVKFTGLLNKYFYKAGVKGTASYKGKYYVKGSLANGVYNNKFYKAGVKTTGLAKNKVYYYKGYPANGKYGKYTYRNGKKLTGLNSKGIYYKNGILGTGKYGKYVYKNGSKLTGLDANKVYYDKGLLGTGEYKNIYYKNGKKFTGVTDKDLYYKNGILASGTVGDVYYTNGKRDVAKTAELKYKKSKANFEKWKKPLEISSKQLEELKEISDRADLAFKTTSLKMRTNGNDKVQAFIDKYKNFNFNSMNAEEKEKFELAFARIVGTSLNEIDEIGLELSKSFEDLSTKITEMKKYATAAQKQEFVQLYQTAANMKKQLDAAGFETETINKSLEKLENSLPEIKDTNSFLEVVTFVESLKWEDEESGYDLLKRVKPLVEEKRGKVEVSYNPDQFTLDIDIKSGLNSKTVTLKAPEAVKAKDAVNKLFSDPEQTKLADGVTAEKITAAKEQVSKMDASEAKDALLAKVASAEKMLKDQEDAQAALKALYASDGTTLLDTVVQKDLDDAKILVERVTNTTVRTELFAKLEKAQKALDAELEKLKVGLTEQGTLLTNQAVNTIDELYTFQMAGIYLKDDQPTVIEGNIAQAKNLTLEQVNKGLAATVNYKTTTNATPTISMKVSKKHGFTDFQPVAHISVEEFNKLDANGNNAYLITLNEKQPKNLKAFKLLFQVKDGTVVAKFVASTANDSDYTVPGEKEATEAMALVLNAEGQFKDDVKHADIESANNAIKQLKDGKFKTDAKNKMENASKPITLSNVEIKVTNGALETSFTNNEAIKLKQEKTNVEIAYFTKENGQLVPLQNSLNNNNPLVKNKTWSGYLASMEVNGENYSSGTENNTKYSDVIPANKKLGTLVKKGYHLNGDMDYVEIEDFNKAPGVYVVQITVTNAVDEAVNYSKELTVR